MKITIFLKIYILPSPNYFVVFSGSSQMSTPNGRMLSISVFPCLLLLSFKAKLTRCVHLHALPLKGKQKRMWGIIFSVFLLSPSLSEDHCSGCTNIHFFDCTLSFVIPCSFVFFHVARLWSIYMVVSPEHFLPALRRASSPLSCLSSHIFSPFWSEKKMNQRSLSKGFSYFCEE